MGYMLDSDWSRKNLLRCDWSVPTVACITTNETRRCKSKNKTKTRKPKLDGLKPKAIKFQKEAASLKRKKSFKA